MALVVPLLFTGCGGDPEQAAAMQTLADFQRALLRHDEATCKELLTRDSAAALAQMPWNRVTDQAPLQVLGARRQSLGFRVQVADPNRGGQHGEFVVVREGGKLVVDLVASAGLTAETVEASDAKDVIEPRELSPADLDRIHQLELARPPR